MDANQPLFRAISHPARREIMALLASGERSVGEVASQFDMTRAAIAKHLAILRQAGLIETHQHGREMINRLNSGALKPIAGWLAFYRQFWDDKLQMLKSAVENDND